MSKHEGSVHDRRTGGSSLIQSPIPRSRSRDERSARKRDNDRDNDIDNDRDYRTSKSGARSNHDSKPRVQRRSRSRSPYTHERYKRRRLTSDNRSPTHRREESPDSRGRRSRRRSPSSSTLSEHRHRDSRRKRKDSDRHRSISFSPSPKRGQRSSRTVHDGASNRRSQSCSPPSKPRRRDSHDDYKHPSRRRSASPIPRRHPSPPIRSKAPLPSQQQAYNKDPTSTTTTISKPPSPSKQKPNYAPTGKLAAETNTVAGTSIILKYNEPPEARLPATTSPWRLYVFKAADLLETLPLSTRSCWLFGRERAVVDVPTEHPSCSKQHAVLQFRHVERKNEYGDRVGGVRPYVIDLDSANGTRLNGETVEGRRYVEVRNGDVVTFGESTREYVVMLPPKE